MRDRLLTIILLFVAQTAASSADVPNGQRHEVAYLLNFIAHSDCIINRNGSQYNGHEALAHIQKKYAYFRDDITNTEAFIERSASKSTFSSKPYTVRCGNKQVITTRQWLLDELAAYRKSVARRLSDLG